jgi:CBS domain-containing protein
MSWVQWVETTRLVSARPEESVGDGVRRMADHRVGALLVVVQGSLKGIFSERDLLRRVIAPGRDPEATPLGEVCSYDPKVVDEETPIEEVARLIREYGFRHVPVVDSAGSPVGIISVRDFLRYVVDDLESLIEKAYREQRLEELSDPYSLVGPGGEG